MSNLKAGQCLATCHGGDATKEEARAKDETDVGEVEGENVCDCESKNAANGNVAMAELILEMISSLE